jgi:uncharacterized protein (DUF4415 family)
MSAKRTGKPSRSKAKSKRHARTAWRRVRGMSDHDIDAQIAADAEVAPELDDDWFARAERRDPRPTKVAISLRVDPDVLDWFRSTSSRYQSQINAVLRAYMEHQQAKSEQATARRR